MNDTQERAIDAKRVVVVCTKCEVVDASGLTPRTHGGNDREHNWRQMSEAETVRYFAVQKAVNTSCDNEGVVEYYLGVGYDLGYAAARSEGWIPVEDRLPDVDGTYLVWSKSGKPDVSFFKVDPKFYFNREHFLKHFSHWQKIEPPQREEQQSDD